MSRKLSIFVHRASEFLTDHEAHGDGLICFSLLNGLANRGHRVFAYANHASIQECSPNLHVITARHRVPANSLAPWEHGWRADRWMADLDRTHNFDLVWRMHPYHGSCPTEPKTLGKPLVIGPLFYPWPVTGCQIPKEGRPRLGIGLQGIISPIANHGWSSTVRKASLILCATSKHADSLSREYPKINVMDLPVIVQIPEDLPQPEMRPRQGEIKLLFIANLLSYKNPMIFCETVERLRSKGIAVSGTVLGDGPERARIENFSKSNTLPIRFLGKVPNDEVYDHLKDADYLMSASMGEPYGRGIAEAMAVGIPCICHRSGGPADFITDCLDGLLVEYLCADSFAARLETAISKPDDWNILSANARLKAEHWKSETVLDRLEAQLLTTVTNIQERVIQ